MGSPFERGLRTNPSTPRTKLFNQRYGASKGDADEDGSPGGAAAASDASPPVSKGRTPRNGGTYTSSFRDMHGLPAGAKGTPRAKSGLAPPRPPVPRQNSTVADDTDSISVAESDDASVMTEDDYGPQEGDSVQVFVRVRPINTAEAADADQYNCTRLYGERSVSVELKHRAEPYHFKFDCVLPESATQLEIFERAGKPIVDNCMGGYNSSIFAYGQTGAGKTYTMQGPLSAALQEDNQQRGLAPRVFQYLFSEIDKAQDDNCHENLTFCCRCSMLEIYNEVITDLLNPSATNLQIREDIKRGCYVEDLSEHSIQNVSDAMRLMRIGAENRHVGETRLNRESSRSHSVFTCVLERQSKNQSTGITNVLFSRLNLIDLAGSERVHGGEHGGSQATGKHFKEACAINRSLTTLGRVITELVEAQRSGQPRGGKGTPAATRGRHVPYRDSRLTFLLQDSLGGNAKTLMIANISPSSVSGLETLSTLQFMSRAKCIRNRAQINLDARGDVGLLQREIARLNNELDNLRKGYTEPAIQENKQLREELDKMRASRGQIDLKVVNLEKENQNLKTERRRLDHKMSQIQKGAGQLDAAIFTLSQKLHGSEQRQAEALEKAHEVAELERQLQVAELQHQLAAAQQNSEGAAELQQAIEQLRQELAHAQAAADSGKQQRDAALAELGAVQQRLEAEQQQSSSVAAQLSKEQQQSAELAEQLASAQQQAASLAEQLSIAQQESSSTAEQLTAAQEQAAGLEGQLQTAQQDCADLQGQLEAAQQGSACLEEQLQAAKQEQSVLQQQLEAAQQEAAATHKSLDEAQVSAQAQLSELSAQLEARSELVHTLQRDVQEQQARSEALEQERSDLQHQLEQQQQGSEEVRQQLADAQEQLAAAERDLAQAKDMATCTEAEAGRRLSDALAALEAAQQQLEQERSTKTDLQEQLAQSQQQLQQEMEARKKESDSAASTQAAADAIEQQLRQQLADLQQLLSMKQGDLNSLDSEKQELHSRLGLKQQQCSELQQQLEAEQGRSAEGRAQVAALEEATAELKATIQDKTQALESSQEQIKQLQLQLHQREDAAAAAVSKQEQLSSDLAAVRESSKGKQEELMKQVTEVHMQLSAAQQEQERLQEELDALRTDNSVMQTQLADCRGEIDNFRGQSSTKGLECELLRKKLTAADSTNASLRADLQDSQQALAQLRQQLQDTESAADENQQEAAEELNEMKRELLDTQQLLQEAGYERAQLQRRMEELSQRLADKSSSLDSSKKEIHSLKATIREQENAARQRDAAMADQHALTRQLQAEYAAMSSKLAEVSEQLADREAELRGKLNVNELQLKEQIVFNARNRQAMNEIRKVINWAQQPPTATTPPHGAQFSRPGSSASRRMQVQQFGHLETGSSIPGSPAGSSYQEMLAVEPHFEAADPGDEPLRGVPPALMLPSSQLMHQGSGGSNSSSGRHYGSSHGHSRHHHHHHHHHQQQNQQHYGHDRYGEPVVGAGVAVGSAAADAAGLMGRAGGGSSSSHNSNNHRRGGGSAKGSVAGSPGGAQLPGHGADMMPLMLQVSGDLEVEPSAGDDEPGSAYSGRDTAGGAPASPALSEAASSAAAAAAAAHGTGSSRSRAHRVASPRRSSGSKQLLHAAAQHRAPPDQQQHLSKQHDAYAAKEEEEDDTLQPAAQGDFNPHEELAEDGRHLMAPQQASSPVPPSPSKENPHSNTSRSRGGRDVGSRRGLRAGSDAHSFSSVNNSKRHKQQMPGEVPPVVLSVSGEWSAGGHDSVPDMRLPAAIVGDEESEP